MDLHVPKSPTAANEYTMDAINDHPLNLFPSRPSLALHFLQCVTEVQKRRIGCVLLVVREHHRSIILHALSNEAAHTHSHVLQPPSITSTPTYESLQPMWSDSKTWQ